MNNKDDLYPLDAIASVVGETKDGFMEVDQPSSPTQWQVGDEAILLDGSLKGKIVTILQITPPNRVEISVQHSDSQVMIRVIPIKYLNRL